MTGATGLGFFVVKQPITYSQSSQWPLGHTLNKAGRQMSTTGKRLEEMGMLERAYLKLKRVSSIRRFLVEDAAKTLVTSYILSRLDYCNCLLVGTPVSSSLSRKLKTLLQDSFSWHPATTTRHLSWKSCTGFPFQNILDIKSLVCVSML